MPKNSNLRQRDPLWGMIAVLLVGFAMASLPSYFVVARTSSVPYHLFFKTDAAGRRIKKGDYVIFFISSKYIEGGRRVSLVKAVACDEGDTLTEQGNAYLCNGAFLCRAKDYSLKGEKLDHFHYTGVIPEGYAFMAGTHKDSYDSRYFGFIKKSDIKYKAYPII